MKHQNTYQPDWRSADEIAKWLGVEVNTLIKWRKTKGLAWTSLGGKTVCYDKKQIQEMLNASSSYSISSNVKLTA